MSELKSEKGNARRGSVPPATGEPVVAYSGARLSGAALIPASALAAALCLVFSRAEWALLFFALGLAAAVVVALESPASPKGRLRPLLGSLLALGAFGALGLALGGAATGLGRLL